MLIELTVRDFAIIDELHMRFDPGFVVLTGETGAGKSIILDAVSLILGGRSDPSMVRGGCERATLEATFSLSQSLKEIIAPQLLREGLEDEDEYLLSLGREVRQNGRTVSRINGRSVSLGLLRQISEPLVDIHGQGEHLSLLKPGAHLPLLDSYGGLDKQRQDFSNEVKLLREIQKELASLQQDEKVIAQRIDMLRYQISEIGAANLRLGEEEELRKDRTRLANSEKLNRLTAEITADLIGLDDDMPAATDLLGKAERALGQLARLDESKSPLLERLQGITFQLSEVAGEVQNYQTKLEFNPQRLNEVEERLELINTLKRKYGDSIEGVLATRDYAEEQLEQISHSEERIGQLEEAEEGLLRKLGRLGDELSMKRQGAAQRLSSAVEEQLSELHLDGALFDVQFERMLSDDGIYIDDGRYAFDGTGLDRVEFLISTNPGEPLKPVAKVASGGETARLMLALKSALAEVDGTPTLIFDEIDQGIGGRVGGVVGRKLWRLTAVGKKQVIVVTHLPQLAGYGDVHFHVSKHLTNGRTTASVTNLDHEGRLGELGDMLGTSGEFAVGGAEAILHQVHEQKTGDDAQPRS